MNYLAELPFVDIFDAKANKAFSGESTIPSIISAA